MQWQTTVTERGQTSIPVQIRKRYNLKANVKLIWLDFGEMICIMPAQDDPVKALRGIFKERGLTKLMLEERRREKGISSKG